MPNRSLQAGRPAKLGLAGQHSAIQLGGKGSDAALALSFDKCFAAVGQKCPCLADWLHPLFRDGSGLRKSCDFLVFHEIGDRLWVLLIELKSQNAGDAKKQIARTRLLVDYLLAVAFSRDTPSGENPVVPEYRGVVFKEGVHMQKVNWQGEVSYIRTNGDLPCVTLARRDFYPLRAFCC